MTTQLIGERVTVSGANVRISGVEGGGAGGSAGDVKNSYKNCGVEFLLPGGDLAYLSPVCKHFQNIASASECH